MNLLVICLTLAFYAQALWAKFYPTANEDEFDKQQQQTNGECVYKTNMGLIIKTNESIADKAVFLRFEKDQTRESCLQNCCSLTNCNLAVYESKEHRTCYLFDCGREEVSRCHFSQHDDYMSMTVNHQPVTHKPPPKDTQDKHENELAGLVENQTPPPRKTTTKSTTSLNLSSPTQPVQKSGEVYGECSEGLYCQDVNAECQDGVCLCTHGYDFKHKACKELNGKGIPKVGNRPKAPYPQHVPKKGSLNHGKSHFEDGPPIESPRQHLPDNRVIADRGPITPSPSPSTTTTSTTITTTTARETTTGNLDTTPSTSSNTSVKTPTQPAVAKGREVDVEQIIIASPTDSAQGPIVALALGLAFTVMLLLFVGCRLRTVKRRIRKGRPLHSNEADYLINGMYL